MRRKNYEDAPEYQAAAYRVRGYSGIAFSVLGWETESDEDTEWSGYEVRTGRLVCIMIGDDTHHSIDPEDVSPLAPDAYCRECGQIGCGHSVYS
jgi:hypothetical protein